jgi:hypothetical protein
MKSTPSNKQADETKLSQQFVEFIDLTDEDLEEINVPGFGRIQGGHHRHHGHHGHHGHHDHDCCDFNRCDFNRCDFNRCGCNRCGLGDWQ